MVKINTTKGFGGNLRHHYKFWTKICKDCRVLCHIGGMSIPLTGPVIQKHKPREIRLTEKERKFVRGKLLTLEQEGCISRVPFNSPGGWTSSIFLREKKCGNYRLILNLKPLNSKIVYKKFHMPSIWTVCHLVARNSWLCSVDLASAYDHVVIRAKDRSLLKFQFEGQTFRYNCLPNGVSVGPRYFCEITKAVACYLRCQGVNIVIYIDDTLIIADSLEKAREDVELAVATFRKCGFTINWDKSCMIPSHVLDFLGFTFNSTHMTIKLTERKHKSLLDLISKGLRTSPMTIRFLAKIIGSIVSVLPASIPGNLHFRGLERFKTKKLIESNKNWNAKIKLSPKCIQELNWWLKYLSKGTPSKSLTTSRPSKDFFSDSSDRGWGATINGKSAHGQFSTKQQRLSINVKELLAIYYGLRSLKAEITGSCVLCFCDNSSAVSCLARMGSQNEILDGLTRKVYEFIWSIGSNIQICHLAGVLNKSADFLSRLPPRNPRISWTLPQDIFNHYIKCLPFTPDIDLFACHLSYKIKPFCSFQPDPEAYHVNAFSLND